MKIFSPVYPLRNDKLEQYIKRSGSSLYLHLQDRTGLSFKNHAPKSINTLNGVGSGIVDTDLGLEGKIGKSVLFDNSNNKITVSSFVPTLPFSIMVFVYEIAHTTNDRIIDQAAGGPANGWDITQAAASTNLNVWGSSGITAGLAFGALSLNTWYMLSATITSNPTRTYLNGVYSGNEDTNVNLGTGVASDLVLGNRGTAWFSGRLAHFAVWDRALSADEHLRLARIAGFA